MFAVTTKRAELQVPLCPACNKLIVADRAFDILEEGLDVAVHVLGMMDTQLVNGPIRNVTWRFEREGHTRAIAVLARYAVTSVELVYRAALAGHGLAILPAFLHANDVAGGKLVRVLDGWSTEDTAVHLVYPSHRHLSARVRAFVDLVVERLPVFPLR